MTMHWRRPGTEDSEIIPWKMLINFNEGFVSEIDVCSSQPPTATQHVEQTDLTTRPKARRRLRPPLQNAPDHLTFKAKELPQVHHQPGSQVCAAWSFFACPFCRYLTCSPCSTCKLEMAAKSPI